MKRTALTIMALLVAAACVEAGGAGFRGTVRTRTTFRGTTFNRGFYGVNTFGFNRGFSYGFPGYGFRSYAYGFPGYSAGYSYSLPGYSYGYAAPAYDYGYSYGYSAAAPCPPPAAAPAPSCGGYAAPLPPPRMAPTPCTETSLPVISRQTLTYLAGIDPGVRFSYLSRAYGTTTAERLFVKHFGRAALPRATGRDVVRVDTKATTRTRKNATKEVIRTRTRTVSRR